MEIELAGLQNVNDEEQRLIDLHAERDNEVDWEKLALSHIDETPPRDDSLSATPPNGDWVVHSLPDPASAIHTPQSPRLSGGVESRYS